MAASLQPGYTAARFYFYFQLGIFSLGIIGPNSSNT